MIFMELIEGRSFAEFARLVAISEAAMADPR
jgi:hypothetical protein